MSSNNKLKIKSPSEGQARASSWSDSSALSTCLWACDSLCQLPRCFFWKAIVSSQRYKNEEAISWH